MNGQVSALVEVMAAEMLRMEKGYKEHETGYVMTDEQLATMNKALGLVKTKEYRPYCLNCIKGPRVALTPEGFKCWVCNNTFGFDLTKPK